MLAVGAIAVAGGVARASGPSPSTYSNAVIGDGAVAYYRMAEPSGTTLVDQLGRNNGTYNSTGITLNRPGALASDPTNTAALFDGSKGTGSVPDSSALDLSTGATIELWAKRTAASGKYEGIVGKPLNGQSKFENYSIWLNTANNYQTFFGNGTTYVSVTTRAVTDTNWHYVVATDDGSTVKIYLDGVLQQSKPTTIALTPNTNQLVFGKSTDNKYFNGTLDEVAIYNTALTAAQIQTHYNDAFLDTTAPVVTLAAPSNGAYLTGSTTSLSGVAGSAAGDSASVTVNVYSGTGTSGTPAYVLNATRQGNNTYSVSAPLPDGTWTAQAQQSDAAGNTGSSSANTFTVDTSSPVTTITSQPGALTNSSSASFSFSSSKPGSTFQCALDGAAFSACSSPQSYSGLVDGGHTFQAVSVDTSGRTGAPASASWTIDTVAPTTTISSGPSSPSGSSSASFSFSANEPGVTFQCSLDGSAYSTCSSPKSYSGLADGSHTFQVKGTDPAGNTGAAASATWTIDTSTLTVGITSAPPNPSNSSSPSFSFSANKSVFGFQCSLDGAAFSACTSPQSYAGLADGSHSFVVQATDFIGNQSTATYNWTVDTVAPTATLLNTPSNSSNSSSATFTFSSSESGSTFQCSLDGAAATACSSPQSYSGLADGSHTFQVTATDAAGNTGTPASFGWTINTSVPSVSITSNPTNPSNNTAPSFSFSSGADGASFTCSIDGAPFTSCTSPDSFAGLADGSHTFQVEVLNRFGTASLPATYSWNVDTVAPTVTISNGPSDPSNQSSASFTFSASETGSSFQCSLDGAAYSACSSPASYSTLANGPHSFAVEATDPAGNTSSPVTYTWTVNTTLPTVTLTSVPPDPSNNPGPSFSFSSVAGATFQCSLDGAAYSACSSPQTYAGLADGSHAFSVKATDGAGNTGPASIYTWRIDTVAPTATITSHPTDPTSSSSASFSFSSSETGSSFLCSLDSAAFAACSSPQSYSGLADGTHAFQVEAVDAAGNTSLPATFGWTVDTSVPTVTITSVPADPTNSTSASFSFSSSATGATFTCSLDGSAYSACTSPQSYSGLADGSHTFQVKVQNAAGTQSSPASYTWHVDTVAPTATITGQPNNPSNNASPSFSFSSSETGSSFQCSLDGAAYSACSSPQAYSSLADGPHTFAVKATDAAGNTGGAASYGWTIDTSVPTAAITSAPADPTNSTSASFSFTSSATGASFTCSLDGSAYSACSSPKNYSGLADGSHTFQVKAQNAAGTQSSPASYTWHVDTVAPTASITSQPNNPSNNASPSFSFSSSETGSSFQCSLDGAAFSACSSPKSYTGLANGNHSFSVKATDAAGNTGAAATYSWTIDTTAPNITLTSPANGGSLSTGTVPFSGQAGTAAGDLSGVTVSVYTGSSATGTPLETLSTTASGGTYSVNASPSLSPGTYTAQASQGDQAGNTGLSTANTFTVTLVTPHITLTTPVNNSSHLEWPTFGGVAGTASGDQPSVTVKLYQGSSPGGTVAQTINTSAGANGAYSVLANSPIAPGTYTAQAQQANSSGGVGFSSANTFTIGDPVIMAAGDIAGCDFDFAMAKATGALAASVPDALVVPLGDNAYVNGQPSEYQNCYDVAWGSTLARTRPVVGEHDEANPSGGAGPGVGYVNYFANQLAPFAPTGNDPSKLYYSYDLGNWHVVVLDDSCIEGLTPACNEKAQEAWLQTDLAAHSNLCTLALYHEPRWSSDSIHGNSPALEAFWNVLYQNGVDLVLNGSAHDYERFAPQDAAGTLDNNYGIRQIIVGTGGYGLYAMGSLQQPNSVVYSQSFGVLKLTLHSSSYDWQFMPISGYNFTDSGTGTCHTAPPGPAPQTPFVRASSSAQGNPVGSLSLAKPAGTASGDVLVGIVGNQAGSACTLTTPSGWTAVPNGDYSDGTNVRLRAYYHVAGASEPSSYTFTLGGGCGTQAMAGGLLDVVNAKTTAPINASLGQVNTSSTFQMPAPSVTTTAANTLLIYAGAGNVAGTLEPPPFMTEQVETGAPGTYQVGLEIASQGLSSAGATGTRSGYYIYNNARSVGLDLALTPSSP